jgi:peptidylprolyl isomerase
MAQAKNGDTVRVHYTGTLDDGTVFDSSSGRDPLEFTLGTGGVIPGFENAVVGMNPGDQIETTIPAQDAYGPRMEEMVLVVPRDQMPPGFDPEVGQQLALQHPSGEMIPVTITDVTDEQVTLDANHPLAGQDLTFNIELVEIA